MEEYVHKSQKICELKKFIKGRIIQIRRSEDKWMSDKNIWNNIYTEFGKYTGTAFVLTNINKLSEKIGLLTII